MNAIQNIIQNVISWAYAGKQLDEYEAKSLARQKELTLLLEYFEGRQKRPLKTASGRDYNVMANLTGVIINRTVSMLVGGGVSYSIEDDSAQQYIDEVYKANRGDILLHDLVQYGSIYGTAYLKIIPNGKTWKGKTYPRLIALNPYNMTITTAPDDIENITAYTNRWNDGDTAWREITELREGRWYVRLERAASDTKGNWEMQSEVVFEYEFCPIQHTKNLPSAGNVYGLSDIEGVIELQDKYNAAQSDINVILGHFAFPLRYTSGGRLPRTTLSDGTQAVDISPQNIVEFQSENARINVAEMQSDLSSSRAFVSDVRRDLFDIASTVDTETLRQNASQITNFGLRVMFKEELAKNNTKQMLYGVLLDTVNENLLMMAGLPNDAGQIIWGDPLPTNPLEEIQSLTADKALGIVSNQTIAQTRNYDWEKESARIAEETTASNALGGNMLRDFLAGRNTNA